MTLPTGGMSNAFGRFSAKRPNTLPSGWRLYEAWTRLAVWMPKPKS